MQTITKDELLSRLAQIHKATIIGITVKGSPARFKRDAGRIGKVSTHSVLLHANYGKYKAKKTGESDVTVETKTWRSRVADTPVLRHNTNGTLYLGACYLSGHTAYSLDGKPCKKSDVADMLKPSSPNKVGYATPKIDNIIGVAIDGEKFEVV